MKKNQFETLLYSVVGIVAMFVGFLVIEARRELAPAKPRTA